jgi:NAD(P)-dependent dehydrogenase (short-subunit alcohol dehydrogenase family)
VREFEGKVAIVTGGASFIGVAIARQFVAAGASVVLADLEVSVVEEEVADLGRSVRPVATDITDDEQLDALLATTTGTFGGLDVLVNGAARLAEEQLATTRTAWLESLDVNVVSAAVLIDKVVPLFEERGGGAVVNIASVSGKQSQPGRVVYPVTKAALLGLTRNAAQELAARGTRVNAVSPGWTWSRNIERRYGSRARADALGGEFHAIRRMADPEEIAAAVLFLASPRSSFTTGADLAVDGGYGAMGPEALGQAFRLVPQNG